MPGSRVGIVSCHVERPLDDEAWHRFDTLQRRAPGGFAVIALMRPPDPDFDESEGRWLERARAACVRAPFGLHTHWTSPTHARPTGGDPAARVREQVSWLRERGLDPAYFCGGGWYSDPGVVDAVHELGLVDCTPRTGVPSATELPTTHSLGALARGMLGPLPPYVHAYFHDFDLLDARRRVALEVALRMLARRRSPGFRTNPT